MTLDQRRLFDRVVLWVLGTALFLSISLLPNVLFSRYLVAGTVHMIVLPTCAVVLLLLWVASRFRAPDNP